MNNEYLFAMESLLKFKNVLLFCIKNTEYKKDIKIYNRDLTFIEQLVTELNKSKNPTLTKNKILDIQTAKILSDYWREGVCGNLHNEAYLDLIAEMKSIEIKD